jgi:hypothetical protein
MSIHSHGRSMGSTLRHDCVRLRQSIDCGLLEHCTQLDCRDSASLHATVLHGRLCMVRAAAAADMPIVGSTVVSSETNSSSSSHHNSSEGSGSELEVPSGGPRSICSTQSHLPLLLTLRLCATHCRQLNRIAVAL